MKHFRRSLLGLFFASLTTGSALVTAPGNGFDMKACGQMDKTAIICLAYGHASKLHYIVWRDVVNKTVSLIPVPKDEPKVKDTQTFTGYEAKLAEKLELRYKLVLTSDP